MHYNIEYRQILADFARTRLPERTFSFKELIEHLHIIGKYKYSGGAQYFLLSCITYGWIKKIDRGKYELTDEFINRILPTTPIIETNKLTETNSTVANNIDYSTVQSPS